MKKIPGLILSGATTLPVMSKTRPGIYFIEVESKITKKIIKIK